MKQALIDGTITSGHARAILAIKDKEAQSDLFRRIVAHGLTVREAEAGSTEEESPVPTSVDKPPKKASERKTVELSNMEERLLDILGTKVSVNGSDEKGKIEIHYFSKGDLMRLYDLLIGEEED